MDVIEACKRLYAALKTRSGKVWSVTHGRGTAYGWITIEAPPRRRVAYNEGGGNYTSREELAELAALFGLEDVHYQGLSISPDERDRYVRLAEMPLTEFEAVVASVAEKIEQRVSREAVRAYLAKKQASGIALKATEPAVWANTFFYELVNR